MLAAPFRAGPIGRERDQRADLMALLDRWGEWQRGGDLHGYPQVQPFAKMIQSSDTYQAGYMPADIMRVERALAQLRLWSKRRRSKHWEAVKERHKYNVPDCALVKLIHTSPPELRNLFNVAYLRLQSYLEAEARP